MAAPSRHDGTRPVLLRGGLHDHEGGALRVGDRGETTDTGHVVGAVHEGSAELGDPLDRGVGVIMTVPPTPVHSPGTTVTG